MTVSLLWYDLGFSGWNSTCLGRPCLERIVAAYKYGRRWIDEIKIHLRYTRSPGPSSLAHFTRTRPCPSPKQASAASTLRSRRPDGIANLVLSSQHETTRDYIETSHVVRLPGMPEICRRDRWRGNRNEGRESEGSWSFSFDSGCHAMSTMLTRFLNLGLASRNLPCGCETATSGTDRISR